MIKLTSLQDEDIFIRTDIIVLIQQFPEEASFPRRAVITTESDRIIVVKEKASIIASLIDKIIKNPEIVYSKTHKLLSERLNDPKVLTNPEEFLGPNYKAILDFWLILDELTQEQWKTISGRYCDFYNNQWSEWVKARYLAIVTSGEVVGEEYAYKASWAACDVSGLAAARFATRELIGVVKNPVFLSMFDNL